MNFAIQQRLRFIDFLLHQYGYINRSALMEYFGISQPQASKDILEYLTLAPQNAVYDKSAKCYIRSDQFEKVW